MRFGAFLFYLINPYSITRNKDVVMDSTDVPSITELSLYRAIFGTDALTTEQRARLKDFDEFRPPYCKPDQCVTATKKG